MARILVIEDDPQTAAEIASCLAASGFEAEQSADAAEGLELALGEPFDAVTLDRMLPGGDGLEVVRRLREAGSDVPVLMVSALGDVDDRVTGLRAGGDDYLVKPFAPTELIARLEVILRRRRRPEVPEVMLRAGDLKLDLVKREAERGGRRIELLPMEFKLLEFLMRNAGQSLSRRLIFEAVWEYYFDPGTNLIDVHVGRLRRKIDLAGLPPLFKTERGVGYMLDATFRELLRTTTFRLSALYGLIFALGLAALLGLVYLQSAVYMTRRVDGILATEARALTAAPTRQLQQRISDALTLNDDRTNVFALFSAAGGRIVGNLPALPPRLRVDGPPIEIDPTSMFPSPARLIARRLPSGEVLVVGRDVSQLQEMRAIIASALIWSGVAIAVIGLACGVALSIAPLRRLRVLEEACREIAGGDLTRRLPVSRRNDELDVFAGTVNYMMGEVERLMGEVKGSTETIAHDLRTPLTRARAQLHRLQQAPDAPVQELAQVTAELDTVLERFRALMRISELEARERRRGFAQTDLADVLADVADLYQPLAEESGGALSWTGQPGVTADADPKLLFEAISNLVDNAIKFSGPGGVVSLRLAAGAAGPQIVVEDNGPGIPEAEKGAVLQRFYRGERDRLTPGSGLGLSIARAILRMHGFRLDLEDAGPGLRAVITCR